MWLRRLLPLLASILLLPGCGEGGSSTAREAQPAGGGASADAVRRFRETVDEICRATPIPVEPPVAAEPQSRPPHGAGGPGEPGRGGREASPTAIAIQRRLEPLRRVAVPIRLRSHVARLIDDLDGLRRFHLAAGSATTGGAGGSGARLASIEEDARREASAAGLEDCILPVVPAG